MSGTDTNNGIEPFHNSLKLRLNLSCMLLVGRLVGLADVHPAG